MKYERLTKRFRNSLMKPDVELMGTVQDGVFRLAELEDKIERGELVDTKENHLIAISRASGKSSKQLETIDILAKYEQGMLVELPCKVGDTVYKQYINEIESFRVTMICQKADKTFKIRLTSDRYKTSHDVLISELGKTVFLTKAEAEQKLKELEDERL